MPTEMQYCYTNPQGEKIYLFILRNTKGTVVKITNYGATITSFIVRDGSGNNNDIVLGFDDIADYLSPAYVAQYPWFGCAVGRYANRIHNASFDLEGKTYLLASNNGRHQLHGGPKGFDRRVWKVGKYGDTPSPFVELHYLSPDGEQGFPGNLDVTLRFDLNDRDELTHQFSATTDKPTPCNLTHHSYFNLNNGEGDIFQHQVRIFSTQILEQDNELVATGRMIPVEGTAYDLQEFHLVGDGLGIIDEYDKSFVINRYNGELQLAAEVKYEPRKIGLQVLTTEPVVHFYSGKWTPVVKGKYGNEYGPWSGLCLETHIHPNAVNIPGFPNTILRPGEYYRQICTYRVITN